MTPSASNATTSGPVWAKRVSDRAGAAHVAYCAGRDVVGRPPADSLLIDADLWTNRAHCVMLARQGILAPAEAAAILRALDVIRERASRGDFPIPPDCEDVHMAVEAEVTRLAGAGAGGRLHTGRSRNDQTTTDIRIWTRDALLRLVDDILHLVDGLLRHAAAHLETVCPGFTHMQPAMATTWGHFVSGWAQGLLRDVERLDAAYAMLNRSPLGAAASFGTSWPIDRELAARLMGFVDTKGNALVQANSLDCITSRGEAESQAVAALAMYMNRVAGVGQDLILLSTPPRAWVRIDNRFVTGSSIMPQKRNPDFTEVTRAKASVVGGIVAGLFGIARAVPAGYNRETQWTKYLTMDAFAEVEGAASIFAGVFETLHVDKAAMRAACRIGFMNAAEVSEALAAESGLPFRACYRVVGEAVARCEKQGELQRDVLNAVMRERWAEIAESMEQKNGVQAKNKARATPKAKTKKRAAFQIDAKLWKTLDDPLELTRRRDQTGSPHPARMAALLSQLESETQSARARLAERRALLDNAANALEKEARALVVDGARNVGVSASGTKSKGKRK